MFVDSHCHLNFEDFGGDIALVLQAAHDQGVKAFLNIACRLEEIDPVLKLSEMYPQIYASVGVHPHEAAPTLESLAPSSIYEALQPNVSHPQVVAIGETGLDFYYNHSPRVEQEKSFREQLELSIAVGLPIIVHTRDAEAETIKILKEYAPRIQGVIHCFSGSQWLADEALALGFYISFSGIVTFPKAAGLRDTAQTIPRERLLLETDAPFLAPVPRRGKRNEPAFMVHTAQVIAQAQGVELEAIAHQTTNNFYSLFAKAKRI